MNTLESVIQEAIGLVEPSHREAQKLERVAQYVLKKTEDTVLKRRIDAKIVLGGSYAKGSWLRGDADIDLFLKFPPTLSKEELEEIGIDIAREALRGWEQRLRYSEHPYLEAFVEKVRVNLVPCFDVKKGDWISAADRSPYHTEYILENMSESLKREARLLKKFMKGVGIYGSEVAVQGFSGYVCEVLILRYGGFLETLHKASRFREREVISLSEIDEDYVNTLQGMLIILDPVDPRRNLGAAISDQNVGTFVLVSRSFYQNPDIKFFKGVQPRLQITRLQRSPHLDNIFGIVFTHSGRSVDILWGQLRRTMNHLEKQIRIGGFDVIRSVCATDEANSSAVLFSVEESTLSRELKRVGPKVFRYDDASKFLSKNLRRSSLIWIGSDAKIYALQDRRFVSLKDFLNTICKDRIQSSGIAPGLQKDIRASHKILRGKELLRYAKKRRWLLEGIQRLVITDRLIFH